MPRHVPTPRPQDPPRPRGTQPGPSPTPRPRGTPERPRDFPQPTPTPDRAVQDAGGVRQPPSQSSVRGTTPLPPWMDQMPGMQGVGEERQPPPHGGFPEEMFPDVPHTIPRHGVPRHRGSFDIGRIYRQGVDEWAPGRWPTSSVIRLQEQLESMGLLERPYRRGEWGPKEASAFAVVLSYANQVSVQSGQFVTWDRAMQQYAELQMAEDAEEGGLGGADPGLRPLQAFDPGTYRPPNPEDVANTLRRTWRQMLGRDITDQEMQRFTEALTEAHQAAWDTDVGVARAEHERRQEEELRLLERETGVPPHALRPAVDPDLPPAIEGEPPETDPWAEVEAVMDAHFQPELDRLRRRDDSMDMFGLMQRQLAAGDRVMGA